MNPKKNVKLAEYTTYKIGGPAKYFVLAKSEDDISEALKWAHDKKVDYFILGGGSNVLVSDAGYDGLVIALGMDDFKIDGLTLSAEAAASMKDLVDTTIEKGLSGFEWAGGLPGQLGGAIRGNAGAFGGEIKDNIVSVRAITPSGEIKIFPKVECNFAYRTSIFKKDPGYIIISAEFKFIEGNREQLRDRADELIEWRNTKHPMKYGTCGSVFKRIDVADIAKELFREYPDMKNAIRDNQVATAYFIDKCGLKNMRVGGAEISDKHPNFIINFSGKARAEDVIILINIVKLKVLQKFDIFLEEEIMHLGF